MELVLGEPSPADYIEHGPDLYSGEINRICDDLECRLSQCKRCDKTYCVHYASKIDFMFCAYCVHDIVLEDSIIRKEIVTKSLTGKKTFTRIMTARHLVFTGQDWMFSQARVHTLSQEELKTTIEYHRQIFGLMLDEMESRKIAANKAKLKIMLKSASGNIPTRHGVNTKGDIIGLDSTTVTTTTVKRTRITATQTNSVSVALSSIIAVFKAQGLNDEQIKNKLMAMAGGGK